MFDYHMKHMEQSSRHFFRPVESTCHRVPLEEVLLSTGHVSKHPIDSTLQFTDYWDGIMEDPSSSAGPLSHPCALTQAGLIHSITKTLSSTDDPFLSSPLTQKEMEGAIKRMRGRSLPGMDGLTAAFYQLDPGIFGVSANCLRRSTSPGLFVSLST
uniref:AlNc14C173G8056 protein n=1 Tax=Albugo laibachii Nc14 TaxID=890382 RepID=F0WNN5_9STRA|nr:AlNc14C173G8056 [Albugo laibachii Nc14]|eukprot:CCA22926.1 AlNc14C173G8056 [Albugo laibachii Nc14]